MSKTHEPETVPCKWCGCPTEMVGTKLCNRHWELEHRIASEPDMARRMLAELDAKRKSHGK